MALIAKYAAPPDPGSASSTAPVNANVVAAALECLHKLLRMVAGNMEALVRGADTGACHFLLGLLVLAAVLEETFRSL
jgi:hypothetical protein